MKDDKVYVEHILEAIAAIDAYLGEKNFNDLTNDSMTQDAIIRNLEIIGEAANNLSEDFKSANPKIDWRQVINMRNRLIHEYFGVDLETVWKTIRQDLPPLKKLLGTK